MAGTEGSDAAVAGGSITAPCSTSLRPRVFRFALLALGKLTSQDVWTRFRQAHEAGNFRLAVRLLDLLPADERPAQRDVTRVERNPAQALAKGDFRWSSTSGRELAFYALDRAARTDAASAHDAWTLWRSRVSDPERSYGNLLVAYNAAVRVGNNPGHLALWSEGLLRQLGAARRSDGEQ